MICYADMAGGKLAGADDRPCFDRDRAIVRQHLVESRPPGRRARASRFPRRSPSADRSPRARSVSTKAMCSAVTCVCCGASSTRNELVSDHAADLLAAYAASSPALIHDATDSTFRIAPPPLRFENRRERLAHAEHAERIRLEQSASDPLRCRRRETLRERRCPRC